MSRMIRIGQGYDIHRLETGIPLRLGAVTIESSPVGAFGHSDGDVVLHALIDALLGACGMGDIGEHFPPSDPSLKGINSVDLLRLTREKLPHHTLENVDITIFLETPALRGFKPLIRQQLADLLEVTPGQVNVKAKTAEGLGAVGQCVAIAASVSVLLVLIPG
jgi:2-C-methyl-D-erythritol 2,4-cyclodiphosphate synthase